MFQIVQRRDTIAYINFIRSQLSSKEIAKYVRLMTSREQQRCIYAYRNNDFSFVWNDLWVAHSKIYYDEKEKSEFIFMKNMNRWIEEFEYCQEHNICNTLTWGFPKGRKFRNETELECALREFEEETTIPRSKISLWNSPPCEEIYFGTNGLPYRTIYFPAYINYMPSIPKFIRDGNLPYISEEIAQTKWIRFNELELLDAAKCNILHLLHSNINKYYYKM
jgi:8-oxo-dGTP pyrophosphatase MutT (NUDIX family)